MFGRLVKLACMGLALFFFASCSKPTKGTAYTMDGAYVLHLPSLNQSDRIVIHESRWVRDVIDTRTHDLVFHESGSIAIKGGGEFALDGFTMRFDYLRNARDTGAITTPYSTNLKLYLDDNASPPALVYDDEYGYVYSRVRVP